MLIEKELEQKFVDALSAMPELSSWQIVTSRRTTTDDTLVEEDGYNGVIAVAAGFREHDAFSLTPLNIPVSISLVTRVEEDHTAQKHEAAIELIVNQLSYWHKFGGAMQNALSTTKFTAGELRMTGGTGRQYLKEDAVWQDVVNMNIRGAEIFTN